MFRRAPTHSILCYLRALLLTGSSTVLGGLQQLYGVQHLGGCNFQLVSRKAVVLDRLLANNGVPVDGRVVPIEVLAARVVNVPVTLLQLFLDDEYLRQALSAHGKVLHISKNAFQDHGSPYNGTGAVRMEMSDRNSVPNLLRANGYRITCEYSVLCCVCRRCKQPGHFQGFMHCRVLHALLHIRHSTAAGLASRVATFVAIIPRLVARPDMAMETLSLSTRSSPTGRIQ